MTDLDRDNLLRAHNLEQLLTSPGWAEFVFVVEEAITASREALMLLAPQTLSQPGQVFWVAETVARCQALVDMLAAPQRLIDELRPEEATEEATDG